MGVKRDWVLGCEEYGVIAVEYSRQTDEVYGHSKLSIGLNI